MPGSSAQRRKTLQPHEVLKRYFGFDEFRPNQERVVDDILAGRDCMAIMPTGAGKSLCYQVPALCMDGVTLVISPLIALMQDQVSALRQMGVQAVCINSMLDARARQTAELAVEQGLVKLVYIAPERLESPSFLRLCERVRIVQVAVDEAHCVSQWGQDFRPHYTRIAAFVDSLPKRPVVSAFTATATCKVRDDVLDQLELHDPDIVIGSFDRPNLHFEVRRPASKDRELRTICKTREGKCGIVYCLTRKNVEHVHGMLVEAGVNAVAYHAGFSDGARKAAQEDFVYDRAEVIVATNAFGMGIDKSNVSYIVHYNMPLDLESYYQEAGRAGRDGQPAECILLYSRSDVPSCEHLLEASMRDAEQLSHEQRAELLERGRERLRLMTFYATTTDCLRHYILRYFGEHPALRCENCSNCEAEFEEVDVTQAARMTVSCVYRLRERRRTLGKSMIVDILRGSKSKKLLDWGFDTLSTYGLLKDSPADLVWAVLETLVANGTLHVNEGDYPVVSFTDESMRFLRENDELVIKMPVKRKPKRAEKQAGKKRSGARADTASAGAGEYDEALFEQLRTLRRELAEEAGVPPYIIFDNAALEDMCVKLPKTREEFLEVRGVGEKRADAYGEAFLAAIAQHSEKRS